MTKVRENRLRRKARRQGLMLSKSRRRDPDALDYGLYSIINPHHGGAIHTHGVISEYSLTLDEVEDLLNGVALEQALEDVGVAYDRYLYHRDHDPEAHAAGMLPHYRSDVTVMVHRARRADATWEDIVEMLAFNEPSWRDEAWLSAIIPEGRAT